MTSNHRKGTSCRCSARNVFDKVGRSTSPDDSFSSCNCLQKACYKKQSAFAQQIICIAWTMGNAFCFLWNSLKHPKKKSLEHHKVHSRGLHACCVIFHLPGNTAAKGNRTIKLQISCSFYLLIQSVQHKVAEENNLVHIHCGVNSFCESGTIRFGQMFWMCCWCLAILVLCRVMPCPLQCHHL